jgi:hypothetical protein
MPLVSHMRYDLITNRKNYIRHKNSCQLCDAMGRKKRWAEDMQARFPRGTFARIQAVLRDQEDRTDFVREAVERELKRRHMAESRTTPGSSKSSGKRTGRPKSSA